MIIFLGLLIVFLLSQCGTHWCLLKNKVQMIWRENQVHTIPTSMLYGPREWLPWGNLESELDDCACMSNDNTSIYSEDAHILNDKLAIFCEDLHAKCKLLKNKSLKLKKENEFLSSKIDFVLENKM